MNEKGLPIFPQMKTPCNKYALLDVFFPWNFVLPIAPNNVGT
jgi:hypothetical protein